ncbi:MAG: T9SS type A sorting domain-containing protein [Bacteroidia bacterium]
MSKQLILILAILLNTIPTTLAQNYYVGTPVYDVLVTHPTNIAYVQGNCVTRKILFDSPLSLAPAGTSVYFKIQSSTLAPGAIYLVNHGIMNAGDSAIAPTNNAYMEFYATSGSGNFVYQFIRTGTPTQVNDSFYCSSQIDYSYSLLFDGCATVNTDYFIPFPYTPLCAVNGPLEQTEIANAENKWQVFPNPVSDELCVVSPLKPTEAYTLDLFNASGNLIFSKHIQAEKFILPTSSYKTGLYSLRLQSPEGKIFVKTISILN